MPVSLRLSAITDQQRILGWRGLLAPLPEASPDGLAGAEPRAVEQVIGDILRDYNASPPHEHEAVLTRGLAAIGRLLGADRCYLYRFGKHAPSGKLLLRWQAPGVADIDDPGDHALDVRLALPHHRRTDRGARHRDFRPAWR